MIARERLRNRRRASITVLNLKRERFQTTDSHMFLTIRGSFFVEKSDKLPSIYRKGPLALKIARGSHIVGESPGPTIDPNLMVTGFIFGFRRPLIEPDGAPRISAAISVGVSTLTVTSGAVPVAQEWYYLRDNNKTELNESNPDPIKWVTRHCGGELVKIKSVAGTNFPYTIELEEPTTQAYSSVVSGGDPVLAFLPEGSIVTPYLSVRGLRITGEMKSGFECWMITALVANLRLVGAACRNSYLTGYSFNYCRNMVISQCTGKDLLSTGGGSSYGFQIDRCVKTYVNSCLMQNARYGVTLEAGAAACTVNGFLPINCPDGAVDIHGGQGFDITFENVNAGDQVVTIGNTNWRRGADGVTIKNCRFGRLRLTTGIHNLLVENCTGLSIKFKYGTKDPSNSAWNGNPIKMTFQGCTFVNPTDGEDANVVASLGVGASATDFVIDDMKFISCTLTNNRLGVSPDPATVAPILVVWQNTNSNLTISSIRFESCVMTMGLPNGNNMVFITNSSQTPSPLSLKLTYKSTTCFLADDRYVASGTTSGSSTKTRVFFENASANLRGPDAANLIAMCQGHFFRLRLDASVPFCAD